MRYERKYRSEGLSLAEVQQMVRTHPMSFRQLHPDRQVNNIYFDTSDLHFFQENLAGAASRHKVRLRWYGGNHLEMKAPQLEMKCKEGLLGEKFSAETASCNVGDVVGLRACLDQGLAGIWSHEGARKSAPALPSLRLTPTLLNTYQRSYLASYDGRYRLTLDRAIHSYGFSAQQMPYRLPAVDEAIVIEVKYEAEDEDGFQRVGQRIPLRVGKNSKYVIGMLQVGNV